MKLSVIVPVYNTEAYLPKCAEALLCQQVEEMEIFFINDGSKDGSLAVLRSYEQRFPGRVRVLDVTNGGQGRARNFALEVAQGEFIGFADSDDWVEPDMFPRLLALAEREQADIAVCDSWRETDSGSTYEKACPQEHPLASAGSVWNKLYRRSCIEGIRFPEGLWYEDLSFSAKALVRSRKTVFLPEALYHYRSGNLSTMRNQNSRKNLDMLKIMDDVIAFFGREHQNEIDFLLINHVLLESIKRVNLQTSPDKKLVIGEFRSYVKRYIPNLSRCESFLQETRNRRLIMYLNYHGLEDLSQFLLTIKAKRTG